MILLTTIVALTITVVLQYRELTPLKVEVKQLRDETGQLTIDDPKKIHAIAVRESQPRTWTYRVFLPPGRNYYAACQVNDLPPGGVSPSWGDNPPGLSTSSFGHGNMVGVGLPPGEYLISLSAFLDEQGEWQYNLNSRTSMVNATDQMDDRTAGSALRTGEKWPALEGAFSSGGVPTHAITAVPDKPLVLLDRRAVDQKVRSSSQSTEGVIVWVAPIEED